MSAAQPVTATATCRDAAAVDGRPLTEPGSPSVLVTLKRFKGRLDEALYAAAAVIRSVPRHIQEEARYGGTG